MAGWAADTLWRSARQTVWNHRPTKACVETMAPVLQRLDTVEGVWRAVWSLTASSALAVTSRMLVLGDNGPSRHFNSVVSSAPADFRRSSQLIAIDRELITDVRLSAEAITIATKRGAVVLPVAAGPNRPKDMEAALKRLLRASGASAEQEGASAVEVQQKQPDGGWTEAVRQSRQRHPGMWDGRHLTNGRILIERHQGAMTKGGVSGWMLSSGRAWRRLPRWAQWVIAAAAFFVLQILAAPSGAVFAVLLVVFLLFTDPAVLVKREPRRGSPEASLASADSIEARVAGAACRAWSETIREPSWSSPALAGARASFDGDREVNAIVDLALRIDAARIQLGPRLTGLAAEVWQQQWDALDRAALRLGERTDALIRHRDQAAALSIELAQLVELERLERSALIVDDLTLETSVMGSAHDHVPVAAQISAARQTVGELIELMTRTRAPLSEPFPPSSMA